MGRITLDLLRKRAEHNEGMVSTLEEIALHQQNIEKIELLGHACRHLKILYLQNNLIAKIQNLHRLKELEYVNLALNNITKVQNLQRCESLTKLDLTVNFIPKAGLLSIISLQHNLHLRDLYLTGNPCTEWSGYRAFVVASLPQLQRLDGEDVKRSERIAAEQWLPELQERLRQELRREGIDPDDAAAVEDDFEYDEDVDIPETGYMDEKGEMRRPWCRETRLLEHRETERQQREAEERKKASERPGPLDGGLHSKPRLEDLPEIADGERLFQKNEGRWEFWLEESEDGQAIQLEVKVGKFLDTSLIKADVRPGWVRLLIKGRLLQLQLPCEVMADASTAKRSKASGSLLLTMPKEDPMHPCNVALLHPAPQSAARAAAPQRRGAAAKAAARAGLPAAVPLVPHAAKTGGKSRQQGDSAHSLLGLGAADMDGFLLREVKKASVQWVDSGADADDDDDFVPQLC